MKIIIGLGNIGEKYKNTRHNVGFLAVDQLLQQAKQQNLELEWKEESKLKSITAKFSIGEESYILAKPTTLMNRSGQAASAILNFYKATPKDLTVIYDDIDLPLGKTRIREKGSAGTHNGMKSIIEHLGTQEFKRIRIGIESRGELAPKQQDLSSFVLSDFNNQELGEINKTLNQLDLLSLFP